MRRLITLISAGRNRTIVIRRELPRTRDAGWVGRPYRIKDSRILLSVGPRPITSTVASSIEPQREEYLPRQSLPFPPRWKWGFGIGAGSRQGRPAVSGSELPGAEGKP
jgi:hypothetical protein